MKIKKDPALCFDDVLLVPKYSEVMSRNDVDVKTNVAGLELQIPIIPANMTFCEHEMMSSFMSRCGLGIMHRMCSFDYQLNQISKAKERSRVVLDKYLGYVGASVGIGENALREADELTEQVDLICFDVAHAHHKKMTKVLNEFRKIHPAFPIIVGNVATPLAVQDILDYCGGKNTAIKIGVGGGSVCSTRTQTGAGVPTFQSVIDIAEKYNDQIYLIADGGIKTSGDIVKSLAAGAHAVMVGSLFAGTRESAGEVIKDGRTGNKYKIYKGNASYSSKNKSGLITTYIEGEESLVPLKNSCGHIIKDLLCGVRSGFSYCGAKNLIELHNNAEFVKISPAGYKESLPHGIL